MTGEERRGEDLITFNNLCASIVFLFLIPFSLFRHLKSEDVKCEMWNEMCGCAVMLQLLPLLLSDFT